MDLYLSSSRFEPPNSVLEIAVMSEQVRDNVYLTFWH